MLGRMRPLPDIFEGLQLHSLECPISSSHSSDESDSSSHYTQGGGHQQSQSGYSYISQSPSHPSTLFTQQSGSEYQPYASSSFALDPNLETHHGYSPRFLPYGHEMQAMRPERSQTSPSPSSTTYPPYTIGISPYQVEGSPASSSTPALSGSDTDRRIEGMLRHELGLGSSLPLMLSSIPDPGESIRPKPTLQILTSVAIFCSPRKKLTLQEIYAALEGRFAYFRKHSSGKDGSWKGSIRHMLSLRKEFRKVNRDIIESGKGSYWELSGETGLKRARIRTSKSGSKSKARSDEEYDSGDPDYNPSTSQTVSRTRRAVRSPYAMLNPDRRAPLTVDTRAISAPSSPGNYPSDSSSSSFTIDSPPAASPTFTETSGAQQYFMGGSQAGSSLQGGSHPSSSGYGI